MISKPHICYSSCQRFNISQYLQSDSKTLIWFVYLPACESKGKSERQHCVSRDVGRVRKEGSESSPLKATPLGFYPLRSVDCLGIPAHRGCERGLRLPLGRAPSLPVFPECLLCRSQYVRVCRVSFPQRMCWQFTVCTENIHGNGLQHAAGTRTETPHRQEACLFLFF